MLMPIMNFQCMQGDSVLYLIPLQHKKLKKQSGHTKHHQNFRLHSDYGPTKGGQFELRQPPNCYGYDPNLPTNHKKLCNQKGHTCKIC